MKQVSLLILAVIFSAETAIAQTLKLSDLGQLELRYTVTSAIDSYPGSPIAAQAGYRPGEAISLVSPYRLQQITYLTAPGVQVSREQVIARLSGPEVHHFMKEFSVLEQRLTVAKKRYEGNRDLYQRKAIDEGRWIEISEAYFALQLEYEHAQHFRRLLQPAEGYPDSQLLLAPADGLLHYRQQTPGMQPGEELALIIPADSLRLRVAVPLAQRQSLLSLSYGKCSAAVDGVSGIAEDYFVSAWSEPLYDACSRLPGERFMVTPHYAASAYKVPKSAVMQWQGATTVLAMNDDSLEVTEVELLASAGNSYFVRCSADLAGRRVLSSSVSAVQGVLMGLGGE